MLEQITHPAHDNSTIHENKLRPNIMLLVADDLGYSDLNLYGGEISTPNIQSLAAEGIMFTNFHALPACSPTRATLLTGVDNHHAGLGSMVGRLAANQVGQPGYETYLNDRVVTIATLLKDADYHTYIAGKWHLGKQAGCFPCDRGFEQAFTLLEGAASHYTDMGYTPAIPVASYRHNDKIVNLPEGFYSTDFYTDKLIEFINQDRGNGKPFFAYAAYTAPHAPLQAPPDYICKYLGKYDRGWEQLRAERFERMKQLGIIATHLDLPPTALGVPVWNDLTLEQQRYESKRMALYAAMIDNLDTNIGRLLSYLKQIGEYENTIIVFLSDNGPDIGKKAEPKDYQAWLEQKGIDNCYETIGEANSFIHYSKPWAQVSATPLLQFKGRCAEGGIRVPAIISYPGAIKPEIRSSAFCSVLDITPTLLEYAQVEHPGEQYNGKRIYKMDGRSIRPLLEGKIERIYDYDNSIAFELFGTGNSALFLGDWKILKLSAPFGNGHWQLFNLHQDPRELNDLSAQEPKRLAAMLFLYELYEQEKRVISVTS